MSARTELKGAEKAAVMAFVFLMIFLLFFVPISCLIWVGSVIHYGDGQRAGVLQKFSKEGIVWKTWEGELALGVGGGLSSASVWHFSVQDEEISSILQQAVGKRLKVTYRQIITEIPWRGDRGTSVTYVEIQEP